MNEQQNEDKRQGLFGYRAEELKNLSHVAVFDTGEELLSSGEVCLHCRRGWIDRMSGQLCLQRLIEAIDGGHLEDRLPTKYEMLRAYLQMVRLINILPVSPTEEAQNDMSWPFTYISKLQRDIFGSFGVMKQLTHFLMLQGGYYIFSDEMLKHLKDVALDYEMISADWKGEGKEAEVLIKAVAIRPKSQQPIEDLTDKLPEQDEVLEAEDSDDEQIM